MPAPSWIWNTPVAHRGLHDGNVRIAENSVEALAAAALGGFAIETDLRQLADGTLVVSHDRNMARLCGDSRSLADLTAADLAGLYPGPSSHTIPTFAELLELVDGRVPLLLDLKGGALTPESAPVLVDAAERFEGMVAVQGFYWSIVRWFAVHAPHVPHGQLAGGGPLGRFGRYVPQDRLVLSAPSLALTRPDFIGFNVARLPHPRIRQLREEGLPVLAWTVSSGAARDVAAEHADNIIFEVWDTDDPVRVLPPAADV